MKKQISVYDYAGKIMSSVLPGMLITGKSGDKINPMTIGWGGLSIEWGKLVFITYVRESRFTKQLLDENPEFTVNIPLDDSAKEILKFCGTKSGRDYDKVKELNLTLVDSDKISVPAIKELPLTLECKIIYKQKQDDKAIGDEIKKKYYPENVDSNFHGSNRDYHTVYYGEIVDAYIIED